MAIRTKIEQKDTHYGGELHVDYNCQLLALPIKEKSVRVVVHVHVCVCF